MTGSTALGVEYHTASDFLADGLKMSFSASTDIGANPAHTYKVDSHVAIGATYVTDLGDSAVTIGGGYSTTDGSTDEDGAIQISAGASGTLLADLGITAGTY